MGRDLRSEKGRDLAGKGYGNGFGNESGKATIGRNLRRDPAGRVSVIMELPLASTMIHYTYN